MAIEKNNFKVSRFDLECSPRSKESMSSDEDEFQRRSSAVESDDDEFDDADSGAGSDDCDLLELGETGAEFCQIENYNCSVPFELYDLPDLQDILSLDVWNDCLTEDERFSLAQYLPDMDQHSFMHTLKDLFSGSNFHFGSPISKLFGMLKGGLCEPRVALYRQALNYFQRRQHYHLLRMHQNNMVGSLCQIRDAWQNCKGYSIEERLQVLNIARSQKSLMYEKMEDLEMGSGSSEREDSDEVFWSKRVKDRIVQKAGRNAAHEASPTPDFPSQGKLVSLKPEKYGKNNPKGLLKLAGPKASSMKQSSSYGNLVAKPGLCNTKSSSLHRKNKAAESDSATARRLSNQMGNRDDHEATMYEVPVRNVPHGVADKSLKMGKKHENTKGGKPPRDSSAGFPLTLNDSLDASGRKKGASKALEQKASSRKLANAHSSYDYSKKVKYHDNYQQPEVEEQTLPAKARLQRASFKGNKVDQSDGAEPLWHGKIQGEDFPANPSMRYDDWNVKTKKWKPGRESPDHKVKSHKAALPHISERLFSPDSRALSPEEATKGISGRRKGLDSRAPKGMKMVTRYEESESDSLKADEEDDSPMVLKKLAHPSSQSSLAKSSGKTKKSKLGKSENKVNDRTREESTQSSRRLSSVGQDVRMPEFENNIPRAKKKGKHSNDLPTSGSRVLEDETFNDLGRLNNDFDDRGGCRLAKKNGRVQGDAGERFHMSSLNAHSAETNQRGEPSHAYLGSQSSHFDDYAIDGENEMLDANFLANGVGASGRFMKKGQCTELLASNHIERSSVALQGCNSETKKRKVKDHSICRDDEDDYNSLQSNTQLHIDESFSLKEHGNWKLEADSLDIVTSDPPMPDLGTLDELEIKPRKKTFTLITPTVHTGFSFSIIHLLSAVRMAMITPQPDDSLNVGYHIEKSNNMLLLDELHRKQVAINGVHRFEGANVNNSEQPGQMNAPSLTVQEIVNRVRSNPGDPCILETQEPLQDLIRGVLKIFSSKSAPLGAKSWKALVFYEKSSKSWSWMGPVSHSTSDHETLEQVTSAEAWGLPHRMLVKLVDSFANWLKCSQETLQQIGSLPAPPAVLMLFNLDEKERFRDLRAQKSLITINPSTEEVRAYFHKEEFLRYSVPDRAFAYTAADGRKSIVAPLRRCGGKPTSKARDHFMLKRDRPPHVTILCLVRDAAARLPGSIGTRADVCTLIRDSQYIVEDVSDAQVNQVVSGALDRLHYERDPCVQFDGDRKLWVYLHAEREEEDFEDDGTSSTKKWKRQKKDPVEQFDHGSASVAYNGTEERMSGGSAAGFDLSSDLNVDPPCIDDDSRVDFLYNDARQNVDDIDEYTQGPDEGTSQRGNQLVWEALGLSTLQDGKLLCQENSTNEDFRSEAEKPAGFLSAGLF